MPTISIFHDNKTSNFDCLEAIGKWMLKNYGTRNYKKTRNFRCDSGREVSVTELKKPNDKSMVSCVFEVAEYKA